MNRKQRGILHSIFQTPTLATVNFVDVEKLLTALGAELTEGSGSRIAFSYNGHKIFLHRPHPGKEAHRYQIEAVREFIELAGLMHE